jgi:hypothetical protein
MRAVIGLLAYLLAVSAIVSVGIMGAMAFEMSFVEQVPFAPVTSGASHEKRTFTQAMVGQNRVRPKIMGPSLINRKNPLCARPFDWFGR